MHHSRHCREWCLHEWSTLVPLKITTEKLPNRIGPTTVNSTRLMLEDLLIDIGYTGNWGLRFHSRIKQKSRNRLKIVRQEGRGIKIRTKPKGNDTCWECILTPPKQYLTQDVVTKLKEVHPVKLAIPAPRNDRPITTREAKDIVDTVIRVEKVPAHLMGEILCGHPNKDGKTCQQPAVEMLHTPAGTFSVCTKHMLDSEWLKMHSEAMSIKDAAKKSLDRLEKEQERQERERQKQRRETRKKQAEKEKTKAEEEVKQQKKAESKEPSPQPFPFLADADLEEYFGLREMNFSLDISGYKVSSLRDELLVIDHALVAVAMVMDEEGHARRKDATESVTDQLNLAEFVIDQENNYSNLVGACREVMNGLVFHGYFTRIYPENRNQKKPTVSGYSITEKGWKRLGVLRQNNLLPENVLEDDVSGQVEDFVAEEVSQRAEEKQTEILPLAEKLTSLQKAKTHYQEEISEIRDQQQTHQEAITGIEAQLEPLRVQVIELQERLADHEDKIETLDGEIETWTEEEKKGDEEIESLKRQIEELLK